MDISEFNEAEETVSPFRPVLRAKGKEITVKEFRTRLGHLIKSRVPRHREKLTHERHVGEIECYSLKLEACRNQPTPQN